MLLSWAVLVQGAMIHAAGCPRPIQPGIAVGYGRAPARSTLLRRGSRNWSRVWLLPSLQFARRNGMAVAIALQGTAVAHTPTGSDPPIFAVAVAAACRTAGWWRTPPRRRGHAAADKRRDSRPGCGRQCWAAPLG